MRSITTPNLEPQSPLSGYFDNLLVFHGRSAATLPHLEHVCHGVTCFCRKINQTTVSNCTQSLWPKSLSLVTIFIYLLT